MAFGSERAAVDQGNLSQLTSGIASRVAQAQIFGPIRLTMMREYPIWNCLTRKIPTTDARAPVGGTALRGGK